MSWTRAIMRVISPRGTMRGSCVRALLPKPGTITRRHLVGLHHERALDEALTLTGAVLEACGDRPGAERADGDAELVDLLRNALGQRKHVVLRGVVRGGVRTGHEASDGGDVEDAAAAALDHRG